MEIPDFLVETYSITKSVCSPILVINEFSKRLPMRLITLGADTRMAKQRLERQPWTVIGVYDGNLSIEEFYQDYLFVNKG